MSSRKSRCPRWRGREILPAHAPTFNIQSNSSSPSVSPNTLSFASPAAVMYGQREWSRQCACIDLNVAILPERA